MASDNAAQLEYHKLQLVGSLNALAHNMRECAAIADAFVHTLNYGANPPPFPPLGANGQFPMTMVPMPVAQEEGKKRKSRGEDADGKKRAKKLKDPNAPKRPASSYLLFQNDVRSELKAKNPNLRNNELLSAIAKMWAEMPQEQKDAYEARNRAAKDEWLAQKAIYESGKTGEASGVPMQVAPVPVAAPVKAPVPAPAPAPAAAATPDSSEESTGEESSSESSSDEEVTTAPPPKKSKRDAAVDETAPKKEKKHKKTKA